MIDSSFSEFSTLMGVGLSSTCQEEQTALDYLRSIDNSLKILIAIFGSGAKAEVPEAPKSTLSQRKVEVNDNVISVEFGKPRLLTYSPTLHWCTSLNTIPLNVHVLEYQHYLYRNELDIPELFNKCFLSLAKYYHIYGMQVADPDRRGNIRTLYTLEEVLTVCQLFLQRKSKYKVVAEKVSEEIEAFQRQLKLQKAA